MPSTLLSLVNKFCCVSKQTFDLILPTTLSNIYIILLIESISLIVWMGDRPRTAVFVHGGLVCMIGVSLWRSLMFKKCQNYIPHKDKLMKLSKARKIIRSRRVSISRYENCLAEYKQSIFDAIENAAADYPCINYKFNFEQGSIPTKCEWNGI